MRQVFRGDLRPRPADTQSEFLAKNSRAPRNACRMGLKLKIIPLTPLDILAPTAPCSDKDFALP